MSDKNPDMAAFGYRQVAAGEKQDLVNEVFAKVAERYDQMNDLMSGGLHRLWKDDFVALLSPPRHAQNFAVLDVAGGTGDIAFRIAKAGGSGTRITVADISPEMIAEGKQRAQREIAGEKCDFTVANAESLPFPEKSFDAYTIAFGIRNVTHIEAALSEAFRVLKPGGRFLCLEFSTVRNPALAKIYDLYSFNLLPKIGGIVASDADSYRYLVESIRRFPNQDRFAEMITATGFRNVAVRDLSGGIAALHSARRI
jgi:demethylmenaquinone methyltransferase/2-methoxy-6-polyprenyl-1,4-benzoquinol methylase